MYINTKGEQDPQGDPASWTKIITDVRYNPKRQVTSISHGNNTTTTRSYYPRTYRLKQLHTTKSNGQAAQDLSYTHDPVGHISHIEDASQQSIYFRNAVVKPSNDYTFDALYRLISSSGREHLGQTNGGPISLVAPTGSDSTHNATGDEAGNGQAMGMYTEAYSYDVAGNLLSVRHAGSDSQALGWTRTYSYDEGIALEKHVKSNQLSQTAVNGVTENYKYEGSAGLAGNMISMPHLPLML